MTYQEERLARLKRQRSRQAIDLAMQGRWQEAVAANKYIIEDFPTDVDAYNRLGRACMELGEYAAPIADILFFLLKVFLVMLFSVTLIRIGVARLRISQVVTTYWIALTLLALLGLVLIMWDSQVLTVKWW